MLHEELRSLAAEEIERLLDSPHAQAHLRHYGWRPGMPVVLTAPYERLSTVMGLVSTYNSTVLIGCYDPYLDELTLWHVSDPVAGDRLVEEDQCTDVKRNEFFTFREMCQKAMDCPAVRLWPKGWDHPLSIREIPLSARSDRSAGGGLLTTRP